MRNFLQPFSLHQVLATALLCLSGTAVAAGTQASTKSYFEHLEQRIILKFSPMHEAADAVIVSKSLSAYIPVSFSSSSRKSTGCFTKGIITESGEKIFYVLGCPGYDRITIDPARSERTFCSEELALRAGWTKAQGCPN